MRTNFKVMSQSALVMRLLLVGWGALIGLIAGFVQAIFVQGDQSATAGAGAFMLFVAGAVMLPFAIVALAVAAISIIPKCVKELRISLIVSSLISLLVSGLIPLIIVLVSNPSYDSAYPVVFCNGMILCIFGIAAILWFGVLVNRAQRD